MEPGRPQITYNKKSTI